MDIPVDAHGFVLSRATHLPGGSHTAYTRRCTTSRQTSSSRSARRGRPRAAARATRHLRASALPPAALVAAPGQGKPAIIPDAFVRASLPAALTSSVDRPSRHQTCLGLDRRRVAAISSPPIPAPTRWRHGQRSRCEVVVRRPAGILGLLDLEGGRRTQRRRGKALQRWEDHLGPGPIAYASSMMADVGARGPAERPWRHTPWRAQTRVGRAFMF